MAYPLAASTKINELPDEVTFATLATMIVSLQASVPSQALDTSFLLNATRDEITVFTLASHYKATAAGLLPTLDLPASTESVNKTWDIISLAHTTAAIKMAAGAGSSTIPAGYAALWDFTDSTSLFADTGRTIAAAVSGPLLGVADKSVNNRHLTGTSTTLVLDGASGKTAANFDGAAGYMINDAIGALLSGAAPFTMFFVTEATSEALGSTRHIFTMGAAANATRFTELATLSSRFQFRRAGATATTSPDVGKQTVGAKDYWIIMFDGTSCRIIKNGFAQTPSTSTTLGTSVVDLFTLGANRKNGAIANFFNGKMYEAGVYASALSDATIITLDGYIRNKYLGETTRLACIGAIGAGQSLMVGRATPYVSTPSVLPGTAFEVDYTTVTIDNSPISNPVGVDAKSSNTGGYIPQWCKTWYEQTGQIVFFVQTAIGATGLLPSADANGNWSTLYNTDPGVTKLATNMRSKASSLHARLLVSPRYNYVDQAITILWDQWNNDGGACVSESANSYALDGQFSRGGYTAELVGLVDYIKFNGGGTQTPIKRVHAIQPGGHAGNGANEANAVIIRAAQTDAMALVINGYVPTTVPSTLDGLGGRYMGDGTHYNYVGNNEVGPDAAINGAAHRAVEVAADTTIRVSIVKLPRSTEGGANVTAKFLVLRHNNVTGTSSVNWAVTGTGANPAVAADFVGSVFPSGTISWADSERLKMISVPIFGDAVAEATDEQYAVTLSSPTNCTITSFGVGIGTITDSGAAAPILQNLSVDVGTATVGVAWSSSLVNTTAGSAITSCTSANGETIARSGYTLSGTFTALPATLTVVETLAGATGNPRTSTITIAAATSLPTTGLYANLDASDMTKLFQDAGKTNVVTAEGQVVAVWGDSFSTHDFAMTGSPVLDHIGARKAIKFNGTSNYGLMSGGGALVSSGSSAYSIHFALYNTATSGANRSAWCAHHASGSSRRFDLVDAAAGTQSIQTTDTAGTTTSISVDTAARRSQIDVWSVRRKTDGKVDVLRNGTQVVTNAQQSVTAIAAAIIEIGCRYTANTSTRDSYFVGMYGQWIAYSAAQSDSDFNQAHAFLTSKWV